MLKVVIIGLGNVGTHLSRALQGSEEVSIIQYFNRSKLKDLEIENRIGASNVHKFSSSWSDLKEADMYIIAVKDDAISKTVEAIPYPQKIVAHTSGSVGLSDFQGQKNAVFYPLQTFSKERDVCFTEIPICLEAFSVEVYQALEKIANSISTKVFSINSAQRRQLHLSAVFVCNFVNHLYFIGNELCASQNINPAILEALIHETASKITELPPYSAQTGPALRGDKETLQKHMQMLDLNPQFKKIYQEMSTSILTTYKK